MGVRNFYAWHDAQQRAFVALHGSAEADVREMDEGAAYAAEQSPVEDDERVTEYADRRGK